MPRDPSSNSTLKALLHQTMGSISKAAAVNSVMELRPHTSNRAEDRIMFHRELTVAVNRSRMVT